MQPTSLTRLNFISILNIEPLLLSKLAFSRTEPTGVRHSVFICETWGSNLKISYRLISLFLTFKRNSILGRYVCMLPGVNAVAGRCGRWCDAAAAAAGCALLSNGCLCSDTGF